MKPIHRLSIAFFGILAIGIAAINFPLWVTVLTILTIAIPTAYLEWWYAKVVNPAAAPHDTHVEAVFVAPPNLTHPHRNAPELLGKEWQDYVTKNLDRYVGLTDESPPLRPELFKSMDPYILKRWIMLDGVHTLAKALGCSRQSVNDRLFYYLTDNVNREAILHFLSMYGGFNVPCLVEYLEANSIDYREALDKHRRMSSYRY